ncbi:Fic family protein [bacterium]|nr:Fic family protein [bacterium]
MFKNRIEEADELKRELDNHRPLPANTLKQLKEYYRVGLTYSSNALEGNSLTETETKIVLEDGIAIGGKPLRDHYEAVGHSEAYDLVYELAKGKTITENDILDLHRIFYFRLDPRSAGAYRRVKVIITGSDYFPPAPGEIKELMERFAGDMPRLRKKYHALEYSAILHKELAEIHPFIDGNGRTARLLMNLALLQAGYTITIIPPILRGDYLAALEKAHKGDNRPFINFISSMAHESLKDYLRLVKRLE